MPPIVDESDETVREEDGPNDPQQMGGPRTDERDHHGTKWGAEESEQDETGTATSAFLELFSKGSPHKHLLSWLRVQVSGGRAPRGTLALRARPSAQERNRPICSSIVRASGTVSANTDKTCAVASSSRA